VRQGKRVSRSPKRGASKKLAWSVMLRKIALIACIVLLLGSTATLAQDAPLTDCDTYAASDIDTQRKTEGLRLDKVDPAKAIPACKEALSRYPNTPRFQYQLGRAYEKTSENGNALVWYRKAARQGYGIAQVNLGLMYKNGVGGSVKLAQAIVWFRKAAEQGFATGQTNLGDMYANGRGVSRDDAQAVAWYRKAAEQGLALAQFELGNMYAAGRGVAKDDAQAVTWYRKAADQGYALAQFGLGVMYENGSGVSKDHAQADAWWRKAADQGNESAKEKLKKK